MRLVFVVKFTVTMGQPSMRCDALLTMNSLEKEPPRRASPWRMLDHPWMLEMKTKKVNMAHFLKQVWDWKD